MFGWLKNLLPSGQRKPPISHADLRSLFTFLDRLDPPPCQHDHRETIQFLKSRNLPIESTLAWLRANGGFCDCEVIYNVTEKWGDAVGWVPADDE